MSSVIERLKTLYLRFSGDKGRVIIISGLFSESRLKDLLSGEPLKGVGALYLVAGRIGGSGLQDLPKTDSAPGPLVEVLVVERVLPELRSRVL